MSTHDYYKKNLGNDYANDGTISEGDDFSYPALQDSFDYKLIQNIKKNPCLYNNKIKKPKEEKSRIWNEIAKDLCETGQMFNGKQNVIID